MSCALARNFKRSSHGAWLSIVSGSIDLRLEGFDVLDPVPFVRQSCPFEGLSKKNRHNCLGLEASL